MPKSYIPLLSSYFKFNKKEDDFFHLLVDFESARSDEQKEYCLQKITKALSRNKLFKYQAIDDYECSRDPLHSIILEMTTLSDFSSDPLWIKRKLRNSRTIVEIKSVLKRLQNIGLIKVNDNDKLEKNSQHNYHQSETANLGLQDFHQSVGKMAIEAVKNQDISEREFNSYSIGIREESLESAKELIQSFLNDFAEMIEAPSGTSEKLYQLNVQFFNITT